MSPNGTDFRADSEAVVTRQNSQRPAYMHVLITTSYVNYVPSENRQSFSPNDIALHDRHSEHKQTNHPEHRSEMIHRERPFPFLRVEALETSLLHRFQPL